MMTSIFLLILAATSIVESKKLCGGLLVMKLANVCSQKTCEVHYEDLDPNTYKGNEIFYDKFMRI